MIIKNMIHSMDCMEVLKQLPDESIDCVITDAPYMNTGLEYDKKASKVLDLVAWFAEIIRVSKPNTPIIVRTYTQEDELVLDFTAGSFPTAIA